MNFLSVFNFDLLSFHPILQYFMTVGRKGKFGSIRVDWDRIGLIRVD